MNANKSQWMQIIKEDLGVTNPQSQQWIAEYAQTHSLYESVQQGGGTGIYATPFSTLGMGNPAAPQAAGWNTTDGSGFGNTGADFHSAAYKVGSGDIPMSTLNMALEVAAMTIGLELVPVVPSKGPWHMLQYLDFPYGGGKLGRFNETSLDGKEDKPIYIKINGSNEILKLAHDATAAAAVIADTDPLAKSHPEAVGKILVKVVGESTKTTFHGAYIGKSRIDNSIIVRVLDAHDDANEKVSIGDVFRDGKGTLTIGTGTVGTPEVLFADLVGAAADHVQGFSNFFDGSDDPMTRAQNETGTGNTLGARFFSKMVQMGSFEVTGTVTRQQLQDMPMYGIDIVGKVLEAMQNELSQAINNRILDRLFKLGTTNAVNQKAIQGVDLNLFFSSAATATKNLSDFAAAPKFVDIFGAKAAANWGAIKNATQNTAAENFMTHQRRIASRVLAAANLIQNVSRFGRGNFVVVNTQLASALQDNAQFAAAPMVNTLVQDGSQSLYFSGTLAGMNVYVDPYMTWEDTRVLVGRKSSATNGNITPGVVFMPYILCDTVSITAEGTMAPKLLCNSRFAIVDAGFHPEQSYFTFMVDTDGSFIL